jgi:hypothetical protein
MLGQHLRVLAWWATSRPRDAAPKAA